MSEAEAAAQALSVTINEAQRLIAQIQDLLQRQGALNGTDQTMAWFNDWERGDDYTRDFIGFR